MGGSKTVFDPPAAAGTITARALLADPALGLQVTLLAGEAGLDRLIAHSRVQKSGLAMVGHLHGVVRVRIQLLGETELSYAATLTPAQQEVAARHLFSMNLSCVMVTRGATPPRAFVAEAERTGTPLLGCRERSSTAILALHTLLDDRLAPRARLHGVLVDVFEVGVLLLGKSGIGKSECALELVMRGHRLVADDVIEMDYRPPGMVFGKPADLLRHHIEVRGLGVLNIKDLYGVTAIRERKRIDLVVQLELWQNDAEYDRLGVDEHHRELLGVPVRCVTLPVRPGRNMSSIIEIAARDELLRQTGVDSSGDFLRRVEASLGVEGVSPPIPDTTAVGGVDGPGPDGESAAPPPVKPRERP